MATGGFGGGGAAAANSAPAVRGGTALAKQLQDLDKDEAEHTYSAQAILGDGEALTKAAQQAQQAIEGEKQADNEDPAAQRAKLLRAYFLDLAAARAGYSDATVSNQALEALGSPAPEADAEVDGRSCPQLDKRLDLVLRDKSIAEALEAVAKAAEVKITLIPGSVEDVAALLQEEPRVKYLDLRRATAAQALDWILQPARMSWHPDAGGITAGTDRRRAGTSAWVYDVADIALPLAEDLAKLGDHQKAVAEARKAADEFLAAVRKELKADEQSVVWYAPGELLLFGDSQAHAKAATLLTSLRGTWRQTAGIAGRRGEQATGGPQGAVGEGPPGASAACRCGDSRPLRLATAGGRRRRATGRRGDHRAVDRLAQSGHGRAAQGGGSIDRVAISVDRPRSLAELAE